MMNSKFAEIDRLERAARYSWVALTHARPIDADDRGYRGCKERWLTALDSLTPDEMTAYRKWRKTQR
jgi:hypothetical protein